MFARVAYGIVALVAFAGAPPVLAATLAGGVYPFAVGDTFVFSDTVTTTTVTPQSSTKTSHSYGLTTKIGAAVTYAGVKAYPYVSTGSFTSAAGATTFVDTEYRNFVTVGKVLQYQFYGYTDSSVVVPASGVPEHELLMHTWAKPNLFDVLPETVATYPGTAAFSETVNNYNATSKGNVNVLTESKAQAADGTYSSNGVSGDVAFAYVLNANGTGTHSDGAAATGVSWIFALPAKSSSGDVIPVTEDDAGKKTTTLVPDWYPGHAAPPYPFATNVLHDLGSVKAPSGCGKWAGKTVTELQSIYAQFDPINGESYTETSNFYIIAGTGRVCLSDQIVESMYDNRTTGALASTTTIATTQVLTAETIH